MKIKFHPVIICLLCLFFKAFPCFSQLIGVKNIPGDYTTITAAVAAVNTSGVGTGGVTFNVAANYTETIAATISLTATGTAANPIIFQKDPATPGADPVITAYTTGVGTPSTAVQDGIWRLVGSDYVTIDGIDVSDNPANTTNPSTMEYGYALYKAAASNGCQFVTIQNCTVTLNRINNATAIAPMTEGSAGIIVMDALPLAANAINAPTATAGSNSNNKFYGNTIQNCNIGLSLIGYAVSTPFTWADANNDIGGSSPATGNTVINYGGAPGATNAAAGIRTLAQYGLNVSYNTINNNNGLGINHSNVLRGIYINAAKSASSTITYNKVTVKGGGTTQQLTGIDNVSGSTPALNTVNINNNIVANCSYTTATTGNFYGITNSGTPATLTINNDTVSNNSSSANSAVNTSGTFYEIYNSAAPSTVTINNNLLTGNSTATSVGSFIGIYNSVVVPVLNITGNTLAGDSTATVTGLRYSIYNYGTTTTANINSNNLGTPSLSAIKFTAANAAAQTFIYSYKSSGTCALSISRNNVTNVLYAITTNASNTYILNSYATKSQVINGNTFTNLNVNIAGNITFISNAVVVPSTGTQDIDSNTIVGTFTKAAGGTVTLCNGSAASVTNSIINNNYNNFSNITLTSATTMAGWVNTDAGNSTKTIRNNVFSKWSIGTGTTIVLNVSLTGINNATSGNIISNIVSAGNITGISTAGGNDNIYSNTIDTLISTAGASATVTGISVSGGTTKNIYLNAIYGLQANAITTGSVKGIYISAGATVNAYQNTVNTLSANSITSGSIEGIWVAGGVSVAVSRNKIYDLSSSSNLMSSGIVYGVLVNGSTAGNTITIQNNLVGDLRTPFASAVDPIRGISISSAGLTSTVKVYYNTVYLNGVSSGANFGSTGLYHLVSGASTTARLDLKNNIINNTSTATGTGLTVAYRRSGTALTNYDSTSNNNLLYAGTPAANKLIFTDGATTPDQLLSAYKTRMSPRDAQSVTEDMITVPKFISTSGSSPSFLHLDATKTTQAESGGVSIASVTTDFDGEIRQGSAGYSGTGTAPDIGGDEVGGSTAPALSGSYNVGVGQTYTSLTNAGGLFAGINSLGLSGNVVVNITSDLVEDGTNVLYQWAEKGTGNYTLTIQPDAPAARLISGNVLAGMIRFSGAKRVTIDGSNGSINNYLTFRNINTSVTTGTAITFINGAANNTLKYCNIEASANATNGVVLFSTSAVAGNSNNMVSNCNINATVAGVSGNICIYSAGSLGAENTANTISNNKIFNYRDRGLDVTATGTNGWIISENSFYNGDVSGTVYAASSTLHGIRILGGSGYTISNNYIGGNGALASGTTASYSSPGILSFWGILLTTSATPASVITGNTIANISVSAVPTAAASVNVFTGIETNGSGINIGGPAPTDGNIVGSNTLNGSVSITTTTSAANYLSLIRGISCNSTGGLVTGNQVAGIDINNVGTIPAASTFSGIYVNNVNAPSQVNNNIIGSSGTGAAANSIRVLSSSTSTTTLVTGVAIGSSVVSTVQVDNNLIKNISFLNSAVSIVSAGGFIGISSAATSTASVTITNNTVTQDSIANYTSGLFYGIYNSGAASTVSINNNTLIGNSSNSASGVYYAIYNTGAVTTAININGNNIGNSTTSAFTFNAINSGSQIFINNAAGTSASALSVSNNNFQGINYFAAGTGNCTFISNGAATLSQTINGNTFTNLNINTAGNVTFITNNVIVPGTGSQNVNNNSIAGTFTKRAAGTITLFTSSAASASGSIINNNSNNFSNLTVSGATTIAGWVNTDAGASTKTIQNNTFSNWIGGSGAITALSVNLTGSNNAISGNLISNISGTAAITGIATTAGNDNIFSNTIDTLTSNFAGVVTGIGISAAGTTINIYKNKIYDLSNNNLTGIVYGISVGSGTTVTIYNNLIANFRTPNSNVSDAIRGISITSAIPSSNINIYYNTIYLNASSAVSTFGTSGVFHTVSSTATTATLNLRNNSITNTSTTTGGKTVAFRRSGAGFTNYASTSNNNLFYAGIPASGKLIFFDGTTGYQTIALYKGIPGLAPADAVSISEDLTAKFLSTAGSSPVFLHMSSTLPSGIESGGTNITGYTDDFDGQIRAGNTGYTGTSSSPDIGADEIFGVETTPPTITYTLLTNTTSTANRSITGINITDGSGVNVAPGTKPRIYYKRFSDANAWLDNSSSTNGWKYTEATNSVSPFTFTIDYSLLKGGATVTAGAIQYFIVAQDIATTANIAIDSGAFAATPSSVALTSTAFPITGMINSYTISYSGTYNVGTTEIFTSLTKADGLFASVNSAGLSGNTIFNITSNLTEDGTNALNQWAESGVGNYTLTIKSSAATLRTISGNVAAGLIRLNGANRVTIDGSISGSGKYLSFKNTNTAGTTGTAFTFINGAANNTLRYCDAEAYADSTDGVILFGSSTAGGNSNNLIDNCTITATVASNTGNVAIYSGGTAGNENVSDTISNNSIYGYRDRGLDITAAGSSAWNISGNSFYNGNAAASINYAASSTLHGIRILGGSGYSILNNYIGGKGVLASGANAVYSSTTGNLSYQGILLTTSGAVPVSSIKGNTIAAISLSSIPTSANSNAFTGIETNGSGINVGGSLSTDGNTIGSLTVNGSIAVTTSTVSVANTSNITGLNYLSSGGVVNNNHVSGFDVSNIGASPAPSLVRGIYINNAAAPAQVNNNLIGSTSASNSIRILAASTAPTTSVTGILIGAAVNSAVQVNNNRIENISNLSTTSSGSFTGINNVASLGGAVITISSDTIQLIGSAVNSNTGSTIYSGIISSSAATISNNLINNITLSSTGINAQIAGLIISGGYATTVSGNIVSNFSTLSNKANANVETGSPAGSALVGILNSTTAAGQIINNNRFSGFSATSNAAVNVVVTGIGMMSTGSGNIFNNRFGTMINLATGSAPALCHIVASSGSFNVYNNVLRIGNLTNTNAMKIYGFIHAATTNWNYYNNSVKVTGTTSGIALRSAAFLLSGNSSPVLKDNIFFNIRTGTGSNYAISNLGSPPSNWPSTASDYNDLYSINSNTIAEWGSGVNKTFAQWQSTSGGDAHSVNNPISFIITPYDLEPDSISNCAFNGAGIPITTPVLINTDINSKPRNAVTPDLGAYEFAYMGFTITPGSNSPVCSGDSVYLTVDPGKGISPHFSWVNPANVVVSTLQNPAFLLTASGKYKVTVTDSTGCSEMDSTMVLINQRPTAHITSQTSLCDSGIVYLNIAVTGTGTITAILSNGDTLSGIAPLIIDTISVNSTTSFNITDLSDSTCTSIPSDIPDTITVAVTHLGDWLGITTNWHDPVNWCGGILPTSSTDVTIPSGTAKMPLITDSVYCKSLNINIGDTVTVTATGTLNIAGILTSSGTYTDNGTTNFNGTSGQQTFSGVTAFNNLMLNNTSGLLLPTVIIVKNNVKISAGTLNANNFDITVGGNWMNNASTTAFMAGIATLTFNGITAQSIGGAFATTFNNLTISNTGFTVTLQANANIAGDLTLATGIFNLDSFTANRTTTGGILTVSNNTTLQIGGTNSYPANYTTNTLGITSTVEYSGANQTVSNQVYGNLKLSSTNGVAAVKTLPATPLTIIGNLRSSVTLSASVLFTAGAGITVGQSLSIGGGTTFDGGSYTHTVTGNWTNSGTFTGNASTVVFIGPGAIVGGGGRQNFNNLTVAALGVTFTNVTFTLTGSLATTGSGSFIQASGGKVIMSGTGKTINGTGISIDNLTVSGAVTSLTSFNITGNLVVSGNFSGGTNTVTMSGVSKTMSGAGIIGFGQLYITGSITTGVNFSVSNGLTVSGSFSASGGTATFTGTSTLSGTPNLYNVTINGTSLQLSSASVLGIANIFTITSGALDVTTSAPNNVNFNGARAQNVNAITYGNLILSNGNVKTAIGSITTNNDITIGTGTTFNPSTFTHSIYGNWTNNGTFISGTSTVQFVGPSTAYISGATTFNILTSNFSSSSSQLLLQSNVSASIVNMTVGILETGLNTLTITATRTGNGFIHGNIQRTNAFTTGVAYAFEGPDNTVTFSSVSSVSSVTVSNREGSISDFPFSGSISRVYEIAVPAGTYTATLRLHYEDNELNGNNESSMTLWHYGSSWNSVGKTANSATSNYVEQSGLTDITNRWTLSDNSNLVQWNGSVNNDWNTAGNWTVLQGSGSTPPSSTDIVDLGTAGFTSQPTIGNNVTVKNIIFGSAQAVTLTLASGGSLTTIGNLNGNWMGNMTHTINVNNQALSVGGNLNLSDGTNAHAINLNIGSGTVTTLNSLSETGGANINFSGTGFLNIYQDFIYASGTFTAGSGTVTYNGTQNQNVANVSYNNLTVNKAGGLASINNPATIAGNLLISSGELDNFSTTTIAGNVTINIGDTLQNYQTLHVQGNWNNNGISIGNSSSIFFDGAGTQTITATTFNNFNINKPVGSSAIITGNIVINGDATITSGTLDINTLSFNRSVQGGTLTLADSATLIVGANNSPLNFSNGILANSSTVIADGMGAQAIFGVTFGNLIMRNAGAKTLVSPITVNGNFTVESGSNFDAASQTLTLNGNWINNGTFTPSTSTILFNGTGKTVTGNTIFSTAVIAGSYTNVSNMTYNKLLRITATGSISSGTGIFTTMNGDLTNKGILYTLGTTTFTGNVLQTLSLINSVQTVALIVNFNGTVSPVLNSTSSPQFGYLNINNTGGVNPSVGWTIFNALTVSSGASFNGGASTHNIYGNVTNSGTISSSGILNFIPPAAATINLGTNFISTGKAVFGGAGAITMAGANPLSFSNVVISNTNAVGVSPSSAWSVSNNFSVNSGSIFTPGNYIDSVGGNISNNGTINSATSTFVLNGAIAQDIFTLSNFNNLTINKAGGLTTLSSNVTVNGVLNFIKGTIQTGSNLVIQSSSGTVTGAAQNTGWINGNLQKSIATGSNVPRAFEIGDSTYYTPATILFANVSVSGNLTASTTAAEHPQIDLSGINKNLDVNRYWTLTNTGVGFTTAVSTFNWVAPDVDAGATTANFKTSIYDGTSWGFSNVASPLPTSIQSTGLVSFGTFVIGEGPKITTWTGAAGTPDWFTAGNWLGGIPNATIEGVVPATLQAGRFFPVIASGIATIDTITVQNSASLTVSNSVLQIKGAIANKGIVNASNGSIEMNGPSSQTIAAGTFQNNAVNNLIISNSSGGGVILGGALDLYGFLSYSGTGMKLVTNDVLTLKSTALNTASVGDMTGNTITGKVTVERYISARKAWRLLSIPTNTIQTTQQAWQEGCGANLDCAPGFGTQITGAGGTVAGFDVYTATPSMKTYVSSANSWAGVPNTTGAINNISGYIIFIRGDRSANSFTSPVTPTVLRTKGNLYVGDQAPVPVVTGKFASIGNPYASALDMRNITRTGLKDFFYVWDPNLGGSSGFGGYQTFSYNGADYVVTPGLGSYGAPGSINNNLQSGQAFLVQADSSGVSNLTFKEAAKSNGSGQVSRPARLTQPQLRTILYGVNADNSTYVTDGVFSDYGDNYSNNVDGMDAIKLINTSENLAIKTANKLLVIERRHTITGQDTIFLNLTGTKVQKYRFQFTADQLGEAGLSAFLEDTYLHTSTPLDLNGSTFADFNIVNIAGSYAPARFRIVFRELTVLPVTFTSIKAYQQNKDIAVEWKVDNETNMKKYDVEKSSDGNNYTIASTVSANNAVLSNYRWLDVQPAAGYHYYRLLSTDKDGKAGYSAVAKVFIGKDVQSISIYPNPVENGTINLQLTNQPAGTYGLHLLNKLGQVILSKQINHAAGSSTETIQMDRYSAHGIYQLEVTKPDGNAINMSVVY